jgi:DNA processing protein
MGVEARIVEMSALYVRRKPKTIRVSLPTPMTISCYIFIIPNGCMHHNYSIEFIPQGHSRFPSQLRETRLSPPCGHIHIKGELPVPGMRMLAIVGTRKASEPAKQFARSAARELARRGFCIVSGLAYGIDAEAHRGALEGGGITCAVLAHGLDRVSPEDHANLAMDILDNNGSLISEYEVGVPALAYRFLERNRIVSALCEAVLVIEAPRGSGAVHTGTCALKQGKRLFVLPGPAASPLYAGSHQLIRAGGRLFSSLQDLYADLHIAEQGPLFAPQGAPRGTVSDKLIAALHAQAKPCSVDTLAELCTLKSQDVQIALTELVLDGMVAEEGIGKYKLA